MRAMVLERPRTPLVMREQDAPAPAAGELLIEVEACGVCRTDLHVVDGELPNPKLPVVPGHEIVGRVAALADGVTGFAIGERVGVPWLGHTCGACPYCLDSRENLCDRPLFTGYTRDGGYATHTLADARFCFSLPERMDNAEVAPLLCAGLIGWRSYRMAQQATLDGSGGRQPAIPRPLRLRCRRPHSRPSRNPTGPTRLRLYSPWRRGGASLCQGTRRRVGRRLGGTAA